MPDVLTIRETVARAKAEGLPVSEYTLYQWVRAGIIPTRKAGKKNLIYWPNLVNFLQCVDGGDNTPPPVAVNGIRKVEVS